MKLGVGLLQNVDVSESVRLAKLSEDLGYDAAWFAEHNFSRDGITVCAAVAAVTERITIGPSVVPIFTRSPLLMATTFAALDEISNGRFIAGIGAGSRLLIQAQGIEFHKPLTALREYVEACRAIWAAHGTHIDYHGEIVHLDNAELDFEPVRVDLPVWLGPTGPKACQLTGEIAQGALLNAFLGVDYVGWAVDHIATGAARGGRVDDGFETAMMVVASVADSKQEAYDYLRPLLAVYLARLPDITKHTGMWGEDGERWKALLAAVDEGGGEAGQSHITDEVIEEVTICGTPDDCREGLQKYVDAGIDHPIITPFGDIERAIRELAPGA